MLAARFPRWAWALLVLSGCGSGLRFPLDEPFENASDVRPYDPVWPLWSNGLDKERWLYVPKGETVDTRGEDWDFPAGSVFFKTFSAGGTKIETRLIRKTPRDFEYATYVWDGDDADLQGDWDSVEVDWVEGVEHKVPSKLDCRTCHEPGGGVLGLRAVQVDAKGVDALADLLDPVPKPEPVVGPDPLTTEVLGYFVGNCVACHDGGGGDQHSFDLRPEVAVENTVDRPTEANASAPGIRVVPGAPEESILFLAFSGEHENDEIRSMPPLGVQARDLEAVELLRTWISEQ